MILYYLRLLYDPTAWQAWRASHSAVTPQSLFERIKTPLKALMLAVGGYLVSTPVTELPAFVPPKWGAAIIGLSAFIQKNPDIVKAWARMTDSQKVAVELHREARAGAPDAVAVVPPAVVATAVAAAEVPPKTT